MKHNRYLLGIALLVAGALPTFAQFTGTVSDAQGVKYTANKDESTCYVRGHESTYSATIEIPETFEGRKVTSIGGQAFYGCKGLTSLTIPSSVTWIDYGAFSGCSGLTSLTIPASVTSIGYIAFSECSGLTSLTIPASVTSIGGDAFRFCRGLTSLTIPSSVTSIGEGAFYGCSGLTSLTISEGVMSIGDWAFSHCSSFTSLTIPEGVTSIGEGAFYGCSGLTSLTIPASVTSIGEGAFSECSGLTSLTIPASVTSIGGDAFRGCSGLTSVTVKNPQPIEISSDVFYEQNAVLIVPKGSKALYEEAEGWKLFEAIIEPFEGTLSDSQGVKYSANSDDWTCRVSGHETSYNSDITIPEIYEGRIVSSIGNEAFSGCDELTSLITPSSLTSIGDNAFSGCNSIEWLDVGGIAPLEITAKAFENSNFQNATLYVPIDGEDAYKTAAVWKDFKEVLVFKKTTIDSQGVRYTANDDRKTCYVSGHEDTYGATIEIPETFGGRKVTSIGGGAFSGCSGLTSLTIPSSVTSIGKGAFFGCKGLTSLTIPEGVTSIGGDAFSGCSGLTSLTIPEGVTEIGGSAFQYCSSLTSLTIPSSVTSISGGAFLGCSGLTSLTIPEGVTSIGGDAFSGCSGLTSLTIPSSVKWIGDYAFSGCSGLTSLTIPSSVTYIGMYAFLGCSSLTSLTIPASVTSIGLDAFRGCSGLTSLTIPEGVTSIGGWAFYGCSSLTSLTIPSSVTSIDSRAFMSCSSLTEVYCYGEIVPTTDWEAFQSSSIDNATLYVPASALDDYKTTEPWSRFKNIVGIGEFLTIGETGMATLYSTNDLDFTEVSGVKAYIASVFNRQTGELTLTRVNDVPARTGLLVKGDPGTYTIPWKDSYSIVSNLLKGVTEATNINATENGYVNYVLNNGSQGVGFYKVGTAGASLEAGHAYLQIPAETATSRNALKLRFDDEDEATGISASLTKSEEVNSAVYDLQGRRVEQPQRGIYIRGGKKVIIK